MFRMKFYVLGQLKIDETAGHFTVSSIDHLCDCCKLQQYRAWQMAL